MSYDCEMKYVATFDTVCGNGIITNEWLFNFIHKDCKIGNGWQVLFVIDNDAELIDLNLNTDFKPTEPYKWIEAFVKKVYNKFDVTCMAIGKLDE